MTLEDLRSHHREQIVALAAMRGAHNVRVFGAEVLRDASAL